MLVLSRKKNEAIIINGNITIVVVDISGDKCRIGIEAPNNVSVNRKEVQDAINAEGRQGELKEAGKALSRETKEKEEGKSE